jgi:TolA-binding protein
MPSPQSQSNSPAPNESRNGGSDAPDIDSRADGILRSNSGSNSGAGSKRKRTAGNSARGVANLTPEQLERKRANDREAQRAIRERTKQQIDRLNERIRELESSQPYRELQVVISEKEAVEAENAEIKRQLASFISVFRSFVPGAQGLEGVSRYSEICIYDAYHTNVNRSCRSC